MYRLKLVLFFIIWLFLFLLQHLFCFDLFDTNLWYFYFGALVSAGLQFLLIRKMLVDVVFIREMCCVIYGVAIYEKSIGLVSYLRHAPYSVGLTLVCLVLDVCGFLILFFKKGRHVPKEH